MSKTLDHENITNYLFERGHTVSKPMVNDVLALITEARIKLASRITAGGYSGIEIFIENVPLETYIAQLKKGLSNE